MDSISALIADRCVHLLTPSSGLRNDGGAVHTAANTTTAAGVPMTHGPQHMIVFSSKPRGTSVGTN